MDDYMFDAEKTYKSLAVSFGLMTTFLGGLTYLSFTSKWQGMQYSIGYSNGYVVPYLNNPSVSKWCYLVGTVLFGFVVIGALWLYLIVPKDIGHDYEQYLHASSKDEQSIEDKTKL